MTIGVDTSTILDMSTPLQDRFRRLADAAGSLRRLDAAASLGANHTHAIVIGRIKSPSVDTMRQVAAACGVSFTWLAFGEGPDPDFQAVRANIEATQTAEPEVEAARAAVEAARNAAAPQVAA